MFRVPSGTENPTRVSHIKHMNFKLCNMSVALYISELNYKVKYRLIVGDKGENFKCYANLV